MMWYHTAADQGHTKSQYHLSLIYEYGHCGVKIDLEKAKFYKEILAHNTSKKNKFRLISDKTLQLQTKAIEKKVNLR